MSVRPYRSALYVPGSNAKALSKAPTLAVDAVLIDLEDAVAPDSKDAARAAVHDTLAATLAVDFGPRQRIVRVNAPQTAWGAADLAMVAALADKGRCDGVLIPKVGSVADIDAVVAVTGTLPVWAMIETPGGILNAADIAAHTFLAGIVMGTNDLAADIGARAAKGRAPLLYALGAALLAARAHGKVAIDGVFNGFRDTDGLIAECAQGRDMGFDGKSLIHPAQIDAANAAFGPTTAEIDRATCQIAAHDAAKAAGQGVAVLDGSIVENLHVAAARALLARAAAIQAAAAERTL